MDKTIRVKIQALVAGLNELKAFGAELRGLQTAPAGGGGVSAKAGEFKALAAEVRNLSDVVKKLEPSRLRKFFEVAGGAGALISGVSKYSQAVGQLQNIKRDAGNAFERVTVKAREFGATVGGKVSAGVESLTSKLPGLTGGLGTSAGGLAAVGAGGVAAATGVGLVVVGVLALVAAIAALAIAIPLAVNLLSSLFDKGVDYNSQLEQTKLGIAAVIASLAELRDASGQKLEGGAALNAALDVADAQLQKLKVDAINTTATFEQIAPAFVAGLGPGLAAGLSLDQIRATVVQIVQAAGALGIPMHQVNQEVRAILEGTINEDARLAKVLGISNEMVKSWKAQGTLAEELNKRLDKFTLAGAKAANTLDGLKSNLQEALNVFTGDATDRAFEALKARYLQLLPQLFDFKNARLDKAFQPLSDLLDDIFVRGVGIAGDFIEGVISGVKAVARFVSENRATVNEILNLAEGIVRTALRIAGTLFKSANSTDNWKAALGLVQTILNGVLNILSAIEWVVRRAAGGISSFARYAQEAIPGFRAIVTLAERAAQVMERASGGVRAPRDQFGAKFEGRAAGKMMGLAGAGFKTGLTTNELPTVKSLPVPKAGGGGGKKGGRDKGDQLQEQLEEAALGVDRAKIERAFNLAKAFLEDQTRLVEQHLEDRRVSIGRFFEDQERIQRETLDAEKTRLDELYALEERRLAQAKKRIDQDKELSAAEKETKKKIATAQFEQAAVPLAERLRLIESERLALAGKIATERKKELDAFEQMLAEVNQQLALETGDTSGAIAAASAAIDRANKDRLAQIAAERGAASTEYQQALQLVDVLKKKAEYQLLFNQLRQQGADLSFAEEQIRNLVDRGALTEKQGREQVAAAQLKHKAAVIETIAKLRELAAASGDAQLILDAERAAEEVKGLGEVVDEEAVRINESLRGAFKDTIFDIVRNPTDFLGALRGLVDAMLDQLARLAANSLTKYLFGGDDEEGGGLLGGIFGDSTGGGIGGFFTKIFGFTGGGYIADGPGTETSDSIFARLSKHEYVIRAAAVRKIGVRALDYLNAVGQLPPMGFALGGLVDEAVGSGGAALAVGDTFNLNLTVPIYTQDRQSFKGSEQAIHRDIARAAERGVRRATSRPK
jgi:plasmid maintenance system antidote protein VapI